MNETVKKNESNTEANVVKTREFIPEIDLWETDQAVVLTADMPGVNENNVDIDLQGNTLEISGTTSATLPEGFTSVHKEFPLRRRYVRQFTLGDSIDQENITAEMKDGVLTLTLPKVKDATPRRIVVKRG